MKHFNTSRTMLWLMVLLSSLSTYAQTQMVGDGFGGRAGYQPVNYNVGYTAGYAVCGSNRQLYAWGEGNQAHSFGTGSPTPSFSWTPVVASSSLSNLRQIALANVGLSGAIRDDGTAWVWGGSVATVGSWITPTQIVTDAYFVSNGNFVLSIVKKDGTVVSVGDNQYGQYGNGILNGTECMFGNCTPIPMPGITNAKRIAVGQYFSVILLADGTVKQVGDGTIDGLTSSLNSKTPILVPGLSNIVDVKTFGYHCLALSASGQVYQWGDMSPSNQTPTLVTFPAGAAPIKAIIAKGMSGTMMAIDDNGNLYGWGGNGSYQLGLGNTTYQTTPQLITTNVRDAKVSQDFCYIFKTDGTMWATGDTYNYKVGLSNQQVAKKTIPVQITPACAIMDFNGMPPCVAGTTAPAVTPTTATNSCPTTTVNLGSLAVSSTTPSGASLIWSTNKVPTSAADTLTTAQKTAVSTAGTYYALYYDATNACYSPADSVVVTMTTCAPVTVNNTCPTATVNLMTAISATNMPSGATVTWHTGTPATAANKVTDPTAVSTSGTYYMAYYQAASNCYSLTSDGLIVTITSCGPDTDGDGVPDATDLDDDNDGISDATEGTADTDGDGVIDAKDLDADNDGINDVIEAGGTDANGDGKQDGTPNATTGQIGTGLTPPNSDNDTVPDYKDLDSDNDGVSDLQEGGSNGTDANNDGVVDGPDTDGDGIPNSVDGLVGFGDASSPALPNGDSDTIPDYKDVDSDGDGIMDIAEKAGKGTLDANNDGMVDNPTDPDGDGIANNSGLDTIPAGFGGLPTATGPDTDGDGVPDATDLDDDNDGISDAIEGTTDTDGDGVIDAKDLDADNDGINDVIEAGGTDANGDGKQDGTPNATTGQIGTGLTPPNSDNDTVPDYKDLDSDNDGVSDLQEGGSNGTDANNDGVVDGPDTDGDGIPNSVDGFTGFGDASSPALPNGDSDTIPDYRDVDSDGDGIKDIVEKAGKGNLDTNNDGMVDNPTDPDGDGIANNSGLDAIPAGFGGLPTAPLTASTPAAQSGYPGEVKTGNAATELAPTGGTSPYTYSLANGDAACVAPSGATAITGSTFISINSTTGEYTYTIPGTLPSTSKTFYFCVKVCDSATPTASCVVKTYTVNATASTLAIAATSADKAEGNSGTTPFTFTVTRSGNTTGPVIVGWNLTGTGTNPVDAADFGASSLPLFGTVSFAAGETSKVITINVAGDNTIEPDETFKVTLINSGLSSVTTAVANATIQNDEIDTDGDGIPDATDLDDDNDGISDTIEGTADTDGDGVIDALDLDSDNDGINDVIEAGGTDANGDGKQDGTPNATTGQIGMGLTPPNSDNDTVPDYKDLDSDNDGVSDLQEGGSNGTDANNDGVVDSPDTDGDGIPNSVDGFTGFGDASSPALLNGDSDTIPDYRDVDSDGDGIKDIVEKASKGTLDANNDGMVDNPTDPDGDGIANNSGLDTIPAGFGGLPTANAPFDLMPNFTFGGTSYTVNATKTVVINVNEIKGVATSGTIEVFVPFSSGFTFSFNATQSTATVVSAETVNNADWVMTTTTTGLKFTAKSGVTIPANGRIRIAITVKADTAGTDASITANVAPLSSEITAQNNVAVLGISIQN